MFKGATKRGRRPKKDSRTIPIRGNADRGDGEDHGRYYRCWHCGFICNVERDDLGDRHSVSGVTHEIYEQKYSTDPNPSAQGGAIHGDNDGVPLINMTQLGKGPKAFVAMENDPAGDPKTIIYNWGPVIAAGCPFCGCRNWRGDY